MKHFLRFFSYLHLFFELNYELILSPHPAIYKTYVKLKRNVGMGARISNIALALGIWESSNIPLAC